MVPIWIVTVFLALVTFFVSQEVPRKRAVSEAIVSDVSATNFLAYRGALRAYLAANPAAAGVIDDAALASFWLPGYSRNTDWTNVIQGGTLFVYSVGSPDKGTLYQISEKSGRSILVGRKDATTGRLVSNAGFDTGINLPAAIPDGAVVMIGT